MSWIDTPDELYPQLFQAVQDSQLLGDSKTFVDALPNGEPAAIVADYLSQQHQPDFDLSEFVASHFKLPEGDDKSLHSAERKPVREHIERLWDVLTRAQDARQPHSSLLALPRPYIVPGGRFREIYYWDSYFTMLGLAGSGRIGMIENMVANFAFLIDQIGFIPNGNRSYYCTRSQPPFFALMVELLAQTTHNQDVYRHYLPQLQREYDFWMIGAETLSEKNPVSRRVVLAGGTCLNRYWDDSSLPRQESHAEDQELAADSKRETAEVYRDIRAGAESGWDYSSRWFADEHDMASIQTTQIVPVDLNCLLYKLETVLAVAYQLTGDHPQQRFCEERAAARRKAVQTLFFDPETQFFADLLLPELQPKPSLSLAGAYPLFFELATPEQAAAVASRIHSRYLKPGGWVTTLVNTGQQWDSPNGWAPLQWIVYRGLCLYGYKTEAETGARRWIDNNLQVYQSVGALVEKYNVEQPGVLAGGGEYEVQDGFGWTNAVLSRLMDELGDEG
ncbi:alpha,alpha-trehalase TreF [Granulosicoccus antarcticus]|uniref:Periplasmic trehalase n=1 Tax=Granulosicoccus antarcticus IMCC3135 TaxID=1192854 RepID=A0A2Z2NQ30_9GAMM|nr:alpha,alpha-trehalase TreF [Granulosicoccus antarcticus]ASJ73566.1 Periplasmic trehalase [Granulosicoccus antarcticus IMCC3135]